MRFPEATGISRYTRRRSLFVRRERSFKPNPHSPMKGGPGLKLSRRPSSIDGMPAFRQASIVLLCVPLCSVVAACAIPRDIGAAERCADIMRRAYPNAAIDITKSESSATSLTTIVAKTEGIRTDLPADSPLLHDLAVECQFDENILTGFRWTAGPTH